MKKILSLFLILLYIVLISCTSNSDFDVENSLSKNIRIEVTDSGFTNPEQPTKTSEVGYQTKFEKGDIVGVYIINTQSSQDNKENIPLTFDGVSWDFPTDTEISDFDNIQLFAYYPYDKSMSLSDLLSVSDRTTSEEFFAEYISCQTLVENQGEYEDYTKADIMVGKGSFYGSILKFEMKHQMSLMVIKLPNEVTYAKEYYLTTDPDYKWQRFKRAEPASLSNIQFTGFTPYEVRVGEYRYIVPSSHIFASNVSGSFEVNGESRQYSFTPQGLNKNEYKEYKITATIIEETIAHTLAIGDIYKSDGGLISQAELAKPGITEEEKTECVGVVFSIDNPANQDQGLDTKFNHGLVMALKDADGSYMWSTNIVNENDLEDCLSLDLCLNDLGGYSNCKYIWNEYTNNLSNHPAFNIAKDFSVNLIRECSGWFLPSIGQWSMILKNLGGVDMNGATKTEDGFSIEDKAESVSNSINKYMKVIGNVYIDIITWSSSLGSSYWSSSEMNSNMSYRINWGRTGRLSLYHIDKNTKTTVRCILAF